MSNTQLLFLFFFSIDSSTSYKRKNPNSHTAVNSKKNRLNITNTSNFTEIGSAHSRKIIWYYCKNVKKYNNYLQFLNSIKHDLINLLKSSDLPIKFNLKLEATYYIPNIEESSENRAFKTSARAIFEVSDFSNIIDQEFDTLLIEEDEYMGRGSGLSLQTIDGILISISNYRPIGGASYVPLPVDIQKKKL